MQCQLKNTICQSVTQAQERNPDGGLGWRAVRRSQHQVGGCDVPPFCGCQTDAGKKGRTWRNFRFQSRL